MVSLPRDVRLLYIGMWNAADDHGWLVDDPDQIRMLLFPGDVDAGVDWWIDLLVAAGRIERHLNSEGKRVLKVAHWSDHQRVDHPANSKISREPSRKLAIPLDARRALAKKYGCSPGCEVEAKCYFCDAPGKVHWFRLSNGRPSSWVVFPDLEIDHFKPESVGGEGFENNLVLSCRHCNRSRNNKDAFDFLASITGTLANPRESSRALAPDQGKDQGKEQGTGNRDNMSDSGSPPVDPDKSNAVGILTLLNELTGREFRKTQNNLRIIEARLAESGVDVAGVELMVRRMVDTWKPDTKMREYLRPETLFNKTKFDSYYAARNEPAPNSGRDSASDGAAGRNALISDRERWSRDFQARAAAHVNYPPPPFV